MTTAEHPQNRRAVRLERTALGAYAATNARGTTIPLGTGDTAEFTPVELLLAAIGGCAMVDVDTVTSRRTEPEEFAVEVSGAKVTVDGVARMEGLTVTWSLSFPDGQAGDEARRLVPRAIALSHDKLCTVGRTVEEGSPITHVEEQR